MRVFSWALAAALGYGAVLSACAGGSSGGCATGELGCPCRADDTCRSGLACDQGGYCSLSGGQSDAGAPLAGNGGSGGFSGSGGSSTGLGGSGPSGGQGNNQGNAGAGPQAGAGGSAFAECAGHELQADGVLDLDLQAVQVAGAVTLNGSALPTETVSRGHIAFVGTEGQTQGSFDLGSTGAGAYTLTLPPGSYEVYFWGNPAVCTESASPLMPCGAGRLMPDVELQADGVLDLDIPAVYLSGAVTLNQAPFPAETLERGAIQFIRTDTVGALVTSRSLGLSGAASYSVALLPGQYDLGFVGNPVLCQGTTPSAVPCNSGIVQSGIDVATGVLDVDVSAVRVTGAVTLAGSALPTEALGRGAVSFTQQDSVVVSGDLGLSGAGAYAVTLLPGVYDVGFAGNPLLCSSGTASQVPCNSGVLLPATQLNADGVLDVNLTAATISGAVTLNDAAFPAQVTERGAIRFENEESYAVSASFGVSGAASYQVTLLPGTYGVHYQANFECDATSLAPCNSGELLGAQSFAASGVLDLNVPSVQISGAVTVNGVTAADHALPRGQLAFVANEGQGAITAPFTATGPASYTISLFPGSYSVQFVGNSALCGNGTVPQIPCMSGPLLPSTSFMADGVLDIDVPSRTITGAVTLEGAALPSEAESRGSIAFTLLDSEAGDSALAGDLGASGPGAYGVAILPGRYVIQHLANVALCAPGSTSQVPCASQVILGCD